MRGRNRNYNRLQNDTTVNNSSGNRNSISDRNTVESSQGNNKDVRRSNRNSINNRNNIRIGTWNVRTMSRSGKFEEIEKEINRMKINVCGLSEVRWVGAGKTEGDSLTLYYSGGEKLERGVGIMITKEVAKSIL